MALGGAQEQGIFISYRRADTRADAGRLYDRLSKRFGAEHVFMDIDDIAPGQDFRAVLRDTLDNCRLLLVLIGPDWLQASDAGGVSRLADEGDFVRLEVATALERGIPVVPVLVNRAPMPSASQLPAGLQELASRQAQEISDTRFHEDVNGLVRSLEPMLAVGGRPAGLRRSLAGLAAAALLAVFAAWWLASGDGASPPVAEGGGPKLQLRQEPAAVSDAGRLAMLQRLDFFDARLFPGGGTAAQSLKVVLVGEDAVVVDGRTGLVWQQNRTGRQRTFELAQRQLAALNEEGFAGHADWRLPTLEEAMSLLTADKQAGAHVSALLSPRDTPVLWTADRAGESRRWVIYAFDGTAAPESPEFNAWLRAVRSAD